MKNLTLALAAAGAIALSVPAPASAGYFSGLRAPLIDAGPVEVQRRCWHRRWSSRWRCHRVHRRWHSRHYW
jgi:hypothetical protein